MALFQKKDATFSKPYLGMVADIVNEGGVLKTKGGSDKVKMTPELKEFCKAVKAKSLPAVMKVIYANNKWAPIFNGEPWTAVDKAPFSGAGGSGAGSEVTALTESLQCYFCSLAFNILKKRITPSDVHMDSLKKAAKYCETDRSLDVCMKKGPADWFDSGVYIAIANKVYADYRSKFKGNVYFHRGSKFMNNLYAAKMVTHKIDRKSMSPQAPGSFSNDKWNPGDIWASTFAPGSKPLMNTVESWSTLNGEVAKTGGIKGGSTDLLGISLKKTNSPAITKYNDDKKVEDAKYRGFVYGRKGDFFSSQDVYVQASLGEMQLRTFGGDTSWQGEIKGKLASGGKIGGGNIDFYADKFLKNGIFPNGKEGSLIAKINVRSEPFMKHFYELYVEGHNNQMKKWKLYSYSEFSTLAREQPKKFHNSKYISLVLINAIIHSTTQQRDRFTRALFRYASSSLEQSSFFIKVH